MTTTNDAPAPAPSGSGVREAMEEARFALFCSDMRIKDRADQALRLALASLASDASPRGEAVAWAQTGYEAQLARYGAFPMRSEKDAAPAPSGSGVDDLKAAWSFLQDRLLEFEQEIGSGDEEREWAGHVMPALSRFGSLIASLASDASPRGEAVAWAQTGYEAQLARYGAFPMRSEKDEALGYVEPLYAHPAPAPTPAEVDVEALTYRVANAKLGEGPSVRCEGPTDFEKEQARAWVKRVLVALASPAPASEREGHDG